MRRFIRDNLVSLLPTIQEAARSALSAPPEEAAGLLRECLDALQAMADLLEEQLSPQAAAAYEEPINAAAAAVVALHEALEAGQGSRKPLKKVDSRLHSLRRQLLAEEEITLEIAFLPYKAAMWDALESVWRAAREDPRCDCHVVPIPYYDRDPQGQLAALRWEGDQFPRDVPVESYRRYDPAQRKPDIIFVHNIYDNYNYVTTVDPAFYTQELKKHTDRLVYIPYYAETAPNLNPAAFYDRPGLANVDRVIVYSEEIRREYLKFCPPEKVLALGSPKFDKILEGMENPPPLPTEWAEIARGRKLVLYNTTLGSVLRQEKYFLPKLRQVFDFFRAREDVCLLWRPHPLIPATLKSMRPQMAAEYQELVESYKAGERGIFDDSADLHRAIALSDGYYGDGGSLMPLYEATGKPMLIQNYRLEIPRTAEEQQALGFNDVVADGNHLWFSSWSFNGLFRANLETGRTEFIDRFPGERDVDHLHGRVVPYGDKLVFVPLAAEQIAIFDRKTLTWETIRLEERETHKYSRCVLYRHWVFLLPYRSKSILRLDLEQSRIDRIHGWCSAEELAKAGAQPTMPLIYDACAVEQILYAVSLNGRFILRLDMESLRTRITSLPEGKTRYGGICHDGTHFWLSPLDEGPVLKWDGETRFDALSAYPEGLSGGQYAFHLCRYGAGFVWLLPHIDSDRLLRIDPKDGAMETVLTKELGVYWNWMLFYDNRFIAMDSMCRLHICDPNGGERSLRVFPYPDTMQELVVRTSFLQRNSWGWMVRGESGMTRLPHVVDAVRLGLKRREGELAPCGEKILLQMKESL